MSNIPVDVKETEISNPANDLECLYILIASTNRNDLFENKTMKSLRRAAHSVGYDGSRMRRRNFPSHRKPTRYDYNQEYYTWLYALLGRSEL